MSCIPIGLGVPTVQPISANNLAISTSLSILDKYYSNYQTYLLILIEDADDSYMKHVHPKAGSSLIHQQIFIYIIQDDHLYSSYTNPSPYRSSQCYLSLVSPITIPIYTGDRP